MRSPDSYTALHSHFTCTVLLGTVLQSHTLHDPVSPALVCAILLHSNSNSAVIASHVPTPLTAVQSVWFTWTGSFWALAVPMWICVTVLMAFFVYIALTLINTPGVGNLNTVVDSFTPKLKVKQGLLHVLCVTCCTRSDTESTHLHTQTRYVVPTSVVCASLDPEIYLKLSPPPHYASDTHTHTHTHAHTHTFSFVWVCHFV